MKIRVVAQMFYKGYILQGAEVPVYQQPDSAFWRNNNFITIRHSSEKDIYCAIPVEGDNILRLQFDDVTENPDGDLTLFNTEMARQIRDFTAQIDQNKELFVNCAAGISRSGAVGDVLNDYFNRYLSFNAPDDYYFKQLNKHIQPNPLVTRVLRKVFFEEDAQ